MTSQKRNSPAAYADVKYVMDLAVEKPGLRYRCSTPGKAINFKQRCNRYRNLLRDIAQESLLVIPGQRGTTLYDTLVIRQVDDEGKAARDGLNLIFEHHKPEGQIFDPETGEEIPFEAPETQQPGGLFDETAD